MELACSIAVGDSLKYTDALQLKPDRNLAKRLLSNRSLAHCRALRFDDGLADAERLVALAPGWSKAHYRLGSALTGLKQFPEAALAFRNAWKLDAGNREAAKQLRTTVFAMTRPQVASGILAIIEELQSRGELTAAGEEAASKEELEEAAFCILKAVRHGLPGEKPYHEQYVRWLREGPSTGEAYTQLAAIYAAAKCYLQARRDAQLGVEWYNRHPAEAEGKEKWAIGKACSLLRLGQACMAEMKHVDQDPSAALKAFARGLDLDPDNPDLKEGSKEARQLLTLEELYQVQEELRTEGCLALAPDSTAAIQLNFRLEFSQASGKHLSGRARESLQAAIVRVFGPELQRPEFEGVRQLNPGLEVILTGCATGTECEIAANATALKGCMELGNDVKDLLGSAKILDVFIAEQHVPGADRSSSRLERPEQQDCKELMKVPRPKLELDLPYKSYRLVTAEGRGLERLDKHPFCMARVYYDAREKPAEVWAEDAPGTYRWRQTGSEVKVIALKVPPDIAAKQLSVTLAPFRIKLMDRLTSEVYLDGALERGIVPKESTWTLGGGSGEDGCLLLLHKMNLELLQRHWMHSEMWWPRLFKGGAEIAWDDYEKDYSDLPEPVLEAHAAVEAKNEVTRRIEAAEKADVDREKERQDLLRRQKLERLQQTKPKSFKEWIQLQHDIAACS